MTLPRIDAFRDILGQSWAPIPIDAVAAWIKEQRCSICGAQPVTVLVWVLGQNRTATMCARCAPDSPSAGGECPATGGTGIAT